MKAVLIALVIVVLIGVFEDKHPATPQSTSAAPVADTRDRQAELWALKRPTVRQACLQNSAWTIETCQTIDAKEIQIGMTADQVKLAWGRPEEINVTTFSQFEQEQWVYNIRSYVYLQNGIVKSMQTSK